MKRSFLRRGLAFALVAGCVAFAACGDTEDGPRATSGDASSPDATGDATTAGDGSTSGDGAASDGATADAPAEASCNADLTTDKNHCGACFHDCSGGTCAGGICTLMNGATPKSRYGVSRLAVSGDRVFFGVGGDPDDGIHSCKTNGCITTSSTRISIPPDGGTTPEGVTVHQGYVYWAEYYNGSTGGAYRTPVDGGPSVRVSKGDAFKYTNTVVVSDSGIWWTSNASDEKVGYCPLGLCGGAATKLPYAPVGPSAANGFATGIAQADDGSIVWTENGTIARCTTPTCSNGVSLVVGEQGPIEAIAISGTTVYFGANFHDQIRSCPLTGCAPSTTVVGGQANLISAIAIDGGRMYWALAGTAPSDGGSTVDGFVRRCDLANCAATVVDIATGQESPQGIALDDKSVYWSNMGRFGELGKPGSVRKAPR